MGCRNSDGGVLRSYTCRVGLVSVGFYYFLLFLYFNFPSPLV